MTRRHSAAGPTVNGSPVVPQATYHVAMNNCLADGGDSFPGFGTDRNDGRRGRAQWLVSVTVVD